MSATIVGTKKMGEEILESNTILKDEEASPLVEMKVTMRGAMMLLRPFSGSLARSAQSPLKPGLCRSPSKLELS